MTAAREFVAAAVTRPALMAAIRRHIAPYDPAEIAAAVNGNERSAGMWRDGRALPAAVALSNLRRWLPGLAEDLRRLEAADAAAAAAHAGQYGPEARLQDGD